jgi:hypothetical protein
MTQLHERVRQPTAPPAAPAAPETAEVAAMPRESSAAAAPAQQQLTVSSQVRAHRALWCSCAIDAPPQAGMTVVCMLTQLGITQTSDTILITVAVGNPGEPRLHGSTFVAEVEQLDSTVTLTVAWLIRRLGFGDSDIVMVTLLLGRLD